MARRPGPSFRALLFRCGEGAVCEPSRLEDRQLRKLVFWSVQKATLGILSVSQPRRLTNGAFATPKQQGPEGRTGPAGHGPQFLTLLSEPTRKLALWAVCLPAAKAHKRRLRHTETAGPWRTDRACGPRPPVPNVAFWTDQKTSSLSCLSSSREGSQTAPSPHRNSRALKDGPGLRATAPVPNVAFWTDKKTSSLSCLSSSREGSQTAPSPHRNSRALKDGPGLRATAPPVPNVAFWTDQKTSSLSCLSSSREGSQTAPSPHRNSRALKDGPGLRATAPSA